MNYNRLMIERRKKIDLHEIKTLLYKGKIKPVMIAERAGVSPVTVRSVLNGHGKSKNIQQVVADLLNIPYESLWDPLNNHKAHSTRPKKGCK